MTSISFEKWEGLGNDFIVLDASAAPLGKLQEAAPALCDRRRGVGADGLLVVDTPAGHNPRMIIVNADGSRPEMCGNGLRCVAAYLHGRGFPAELSIDTDAGVRGCAVEAGADAAMVETDVGEISFMAGSKQPSTLRSDDWGGGYYANAGNPHWVFLEYPADASLPELGAKHENDLRFPDRTNVELVDKLGPLTWRLRVWERGVGITQACGTAAAAVAGLLVALGRAPADERLRMQLPGGELQVTISAGTLRALMRGPARRSFRGELVV